jgi:hypothetical protein
MKPALAVARTVDDDVIVAISTELLRVAVTVSTTRSTVLVRVQVCIEVV